MWDEFAKALKENDAALRSGQGLDKDTPYFGDEFLLGRFRYKLILVTGPVAHFPRVNVKSPIATLLQLPDSDNNSLILELVEEFYNSPTHESFGITRLWDFYRRGRFY
jgi:hypothetical protein